MMHTVHYMALATLESHKGWAAPVELPPEQSQDGVLVVPVTRELDFFPQYRLDWNIYRGSGNFSDSHGMLQPASNGCLKVLIGGESVKFGRRLIDGKPRCYKYIGSFEHGDFAFDLCEIVADNEKLLDDLYDAKKIVISGCEPATEYGEWKQFIESPAGLVKIR